MREQSDKAMTAVTGAPSGAIGLAAARPQSLWRSFWRRFCRHRLALLGMTVLIVLTLSTLLGPLVYQHRINDIDFAVSLQGPSLAHPLGTDDLGQDLLARILYGGRVSIAVGLVAMLIAILIGTAIGATAGYWGGWVDHVLMRLTDLFIALPPLPLLLLVVYLFRDTMRRLFNPELGIFLLIVLVIGGLRWMQPARLGAAAFLSPQEEEIVTGPGGGVH